MNLTHIWVKKDHVQKQTGGDGDKNGDLTGEAFDWHPSFFFFAYALGGKLFKCGIL